MTDIFEYLSERPYPGRGIMLGATPSGKSVCAYFIMGRSENSRNRVFEKTADGIRTRAWDESKMTDPSLIIYHPVRRVGRGIVVTNGDQTDTIRDHILAGQTFAAALRTREFEPDGPNWTPRISGLLSPDGSFKLSILKAGSEPARPACGISTSTRPRSPARAASSAPTRASAPRCRAFMASRSRSSCRSSTPPRSPEGSGRRSTRTIRSPSTSRSAARRL